MAVATSLENHRNQDQAGVSDNILVCPACLLYNTYRTYAVGGFVDQPASCSQGPRDSSTAGRRYLLSYIFRGLAAANLGGQTILGLALENRDL